MDDSPHTLTTIRAAHDVTIEMDARGWRLYNGAQHPDQPETRVALMEATEQAIICAPAFAQARRLPALRLTAADIARVVVGWAPESRNWHLGLLLAARPENGYRMRWCGLASWPSGDESASMQEAHQAGRALAHLLGRPLHVIPAPSAPPAVSNGDTQPVQATTPVEVLRPEQETVSPDDDTIPLHRLPFVFEAWTLERTEQGLLWRRRTRWVMTTLGKVTALLILVAFYLVLGIGTQTSGIAPVKPSWLPWLGIAVAFWLLYRAWDNVRALLRAQDVLLDPEAREVRAMGHFSGKERWRLPFDAVAYVLLSQTPAQPQGLRHKDEHTSIVQDVWLHLADHDDRFYEIVSLEQVEGVCHHWDAVKRQQKTHERRALHLRDYDTPAHHAARLLAETLDVPLWMDVL